MRTVASALLGAVAAGVVAIAPTAAQDDPCAPAARKAPPVGSWASYRMTSKNETSAMRMALVGTETRAGKAHYWIEMRMTPAAGEGKGMIMKMLVPDWPYEPASVQEMVMQPAGGQAMLVGGQMLNMMRQNMKNQPGLTLKEMCAGNQVVGTERVTVPAGSYSARHIRNARHGSEVWVSSKVPFGIVRNTVPEGVMELTAVGTGAKSEITGTPKDMMAR